MAERTRELEEANAHLAELAATLAANCRSADLVARYGGEEFAVLLPETSAEQAVELAGRLRQAIEGADYGNAGRITASFGVSELGADGSPAQIVRSADRALYEAKAQGPQPGGIVRKIKAFASTMNASGSRLWGKKKHHAVTGVRFAADRHQAPRLLP